MNEWLEIIGENPTLILTSVKGFVNKYNDPTTFLSAVAMIMEEGCLKFNLDTVETFKKLTDLAEEVNAICGPYQPN